MGSSISETGDLLRKLGLPLEKFEDDFALSKEKNLKRGILTQLHLLLYLHQLATQDLLDPLLLQ